MATLAQLNRQNRLWCVLVRDTLATLVHWSKFM